jgi:hypothetical protein
MYKEEKMYMQVKDVYYQSLDSKRALVPVNL